MQTVIETKYYAGRAAKILSVDERDEAIELVARNPTIGDLIRQSGGLRKVRLGAGNKGKSGGVRIVYYFYDAGHPIFFLEVFPKNEKADLSTAQLKELAEVGKALKASFRNR
jgi:hypothetical protein